jgi:hypothetical protein
MAGSPQQLKVIFYAIRICWKFFFLYQKNGEESKISLISHPLFSEVCRAGSPKIIAKSLEFKATLWY